MMTGCLKDRGIKVQKVLMFILHFVLKQYYVFRSAELVSFLILIFSIFVITKLKRCAAFQALVVCCRG
jgi:hypothetical protein